MVSFDMLGMVSYHSKFDPKMHRFSRYSITGINRVSISFQAE